MSLRERAIHMSIHNPPFGGRSSLKEAALTFQRKLRNEPKVIPARKIEKIRKLHADRKEGFYESDMALERIWGWSRIDLGFAVKNKAISLGDLLEITSEYIDFDRNRPVHEIKEVIYLDMESSKKDNPAHRFLDSEINDPKIITFGDNIVYWKKIGTLPDPRKDLIQRNVLDNQLLDFSDTISD